MKKCGVQLNEWMQAHPNEWKTARDEVLKVLETKSPQKIAAWEEKLKHEVKAITTKASHQSAHGAAHPKWVQLQIKTLLLNEYYQRLSHQHLEGSKPLSFRDRWICNFLFFRQNLTRKPVSLRLFKILWPFVQQKSRFLSLVYKSGIYCFFSSDLLSKILEKIEHGFALEIAAGDGSLSRMLQKAGVSCIATDDHSWAHRIQFPKDVENISATNALKKYQPTHVICCWPPPQNDFEKEIFKNPSVEQYIVLTSRHEFACGDWAAYRSQTQFEMKEPHELRALLLPPEIDPCVLVFERKTSLKHFS
jgi:hypothetical protein